MKEKDMIKGEQIESIDNELFGSFDPGDESWIVGGSKSLTTVYSFGPDGVVDHALDFDWADLEAQQNSVH